MKKVVINFLKMVVFFACVVAVYFGLKYVIVDDTESQTRITLHDFYTLEDNIDTLFIGPSHVFRGIDTQALTDASRTGQRYFTLATSAQDLAGSYYLLQEAIKSHKLKQVYLEVSPTSISKEIGDEVKTYMITDYMKPSINKYKYLFEVIDPECYSNAFFTVCRTLDILNEGVDTKEWFATAEKKDYVYKNYAYRGDGKDLQYAGRGHWVAGGNFREKGALIKITSTDIMMNHGVFDETEVEYLQKITDLCKEQNLPLNIIVMPFSDLYVACQPEAYQEYVDFLKEFTESRNLPFVDFNALSREDLPLTNEHFRDFDHLNGDGSELFTNYLLNYIEGEDHSKFYDTAVERVDTENRFFGARYAVEPNKRTKQTVVTFSPFYNMDGVDFRWRFFIVDKNENIVVENLPFEEGDEYVFEFGEEYQNMNLQINAIGENDTLLYYTRIKIQ